MNKMFFLAALAAAVFLASCAATTPVRHHEAQSTPGVITMAPSWPVGEPTSPYHTPATPPRSRTSSTPPIASDPAFARLPDEQKVVAVLAAIDRVTQVSPACQRFMKKHRRRRHVIPAWELKKVAWECVMNDHAVAARTQEIIAAAGLEVEWRTNSRGKRDVYRGGSRVTTLSPRAYPVGTPLEEGQTSLTRGEKIWFIVGGAVALTAMVIGGGVAISLGVDP